MLLSVHTPKTGGRTLERHLQEAYGSRLLQHPHDWTELRTPDAVARRERHRAELIGDPTTFAQRYDAVHGHYGASKYLSSFPGARLVTFVRDPVQHVISTYDMARRVPLTEHPMHAAFKQRDASIFDMLERFPNLQSVYVDVALERFALVGIYERYDESLAMFESLFGVTLANRDLRVNVNPNRFGETYPAPPELRRAVTRWCAQDNELYGRAVERFDRMRSGNRACPT